MPRLRTFAGHSGKRKRKYDVQSIRQSNSGTLTHTYPLKSAEKHESQMQCFVAGSIESDATVLSVALSPRQDVASNHVELVGCAGHGIHAQQDFEMLDGTGGWDATGSNRRGKPCRIGYQDSRRLRALAR